MANPDDTCRNEILRYLYDVHRKARSPKSAAIGIRDLGKALKPLGYKQQQVAHNLDYLIQKGWIAEVVEDRTFTTRRGTTQQAEKRSYKISDIGIDKLEASSIYQRNEGKSEINITNIHGVSVVGDKNVVNTEFTDLYRVLQEAREAILSSAELEDETTLNIVADIDSLQSQLQKPSPNKSIIKTLWSSIEKAVTASGFIELVSKIGNLIAPLLG